MEEGGEGAGGEVEGEVGGAWESFLRVKDGEGLEGGWGRFGWVWDMIP